MMKFSVILFILPLCLTMGLYSQNSNEEKSTRQEESKSTDKIDAIFKQEPPQGSAEPGMPILPEGLGIIDLDPSTKEKYFEALREHFQYRISGFYHRQEVFKWQLFSSRVIFFVVILLVIAGIYFSGVQFHSSLKMKRAQETSDKGEITEVVASIKGIKVSSPVLGVIILVISLLFFYLYLAHVYPIEEIF